MGSTRGGGAASDWDTDGMMPVAPGSGGDAKRGMRAIQRGDNEKEQRTHGVSGLAGQEILRTFRRAMQSLAPMGSLFQWRQHFPVMSWGLPRTLFSSIW